MNLAKLHQAWVIRGGEEHLAGQSLSSSLPALWLDSFFLTEIISSQGAVFQHSSHWGSGHLLYGLLKKNDHLQILLGCFQAFLILWRREIRGSWWRELATSSWLFWRYKSTWNGNSYTSCLEHPLTVLPALSAPAPVWQLSCVWPTGLVKYSCKGKGRWSYLAPSPPEGNAAPARACPEQAQTHWAHNWE